MAIGKVHVPQEEGTVVFTGGRHDEPRTYQVQGHLVSPRTQQEHDELLLLVEGARKATKADEPKGSGGKPTSSRGRPAGGPSPAGTPGADT